MLNRIKSDFFSWVFLIGIILIFIEIILFGWGLIFSLLFSMAFIYIGKKRLSKTWGKLFFWFGVITGVITVVNMVAFKFFVLAILLYVIIHFAQSKKQPDYIRPILQEQEDSQGKDAVCRRPIVLKNVLFGKQKTTDHVYDWNDINIQTGIGDTVIDLSNTILPKSECVISIRNLVGNVQILVPYDVEVSVHHSIIAGSMAVFDYREPRLFNETLNVQTPGYGDSVQKIKIITSMITGNLEVKRI
ncbi:cell wall-active antibiotics response protein LiaF [Fictibacillus gelatini]|uniref:cell wall-active antibiotics response protein LiaF n=1 Tax=Fictibacillus gelatini TaxID=225985 RepID=UPI0003F73CE4|nr:cell wall-active antibiotics response protein LiaF [Fictibacillus gelatini]